MKLPYKRMQTDMDYEVFLWLQDKAKELGISRNALVRQIVRAEMQRDEEEK